MFVNYEYKRYTEVKQLIFQHISEESHQNIENEIKVQMQAYINSRIWWNMDVKCLVENKIKNLIKKEREWKRIDAKPANVMTASAMSAIANAIKTSQQRNN